ncbi:hypothetical protein [Frateuria defendens]|uniref:hypothetical protein n=1 Tax=Frateuria defendens TaxID=2219559 RepID=UPI00066FE4DE|nr:hypothetical protein [Frateuria defendens]
MACFLFKLLPPRPGFPGDMTEAEAGAMREHVAYWSALVQQGRAIAFGPVPIRAAPTASAFSRWRRAPIRSAWRRTTR